VDATRACDAALPQLVKFFDHLPHEKQEELKSLLAQTDTDNLWEVFNLESNTGLQPVVFFFWCLISAESESSKQQESKQASKQESKQASKRASVQSNMRVVKRDGSVSNVDFNEILQRLLSLCSERERAELDVVEVAANTIGRMVDGISTSKLDKLAADICASMQSRHYLYGEFAGKLLLSDLHKSMKAALQQATIPTFSQRVAFYNSHSSSSSSSSCCSQGDGGSAGGGGYFDDDFLAFVKAHADQLDAMIDYSSTGLNAGYFAVKTLERSYLLKLPAMGLVVESPQDMFMRVAVAIHHTQLGTGEGGTLEGVMGRIQETYEALVSGRMTHATPTLFNAGCRFPQMSSCYLMGTRDSLSGIFKTLSDCAQISKWAGGIGLHVSNIRAKGSTIKSTNGSADGLVPMLRVFNETARYCNQAGKRKGSICVYLEPWHADVYDFVELRRNTGADTERTRDLFLALWVPDLFMRQVVEEGVWYLMSPDECPGLCDHWGAKFEELYGQYVREGRFRRKVHARDLWMHILRCQMETGTPYICFKDTVNWCSNHSNVGPIRSSNLCAEITIYSDDCTYGVCNLASIAVNKFVHRIVGAAATAAAAVVDHVGLHHMARMVTRNLNRIIDSNFYPTEETRRSNLSLRPMGIGIQGFADLLCLLHMPYDSLEALTVSSQIMETIYHGAITESVELAQQHGPYERFAGSPLSRGQFQFDLWAKRVEGDAAAVAANQQLLSGRWDWEVLRERVITHGTRNSLFTALMPTASTSQILGNQECFEPYTSNMYKRTTLAGEFLVINCHLMSELMALGLWSGDMMDSIVAADGSIQELSPIPSHVKRMYKTVWELPQKWIVDHAVARAPFVDQSQSMNLFYERPDYPRLSSALVYSWSKGLKTGCYYLRSKPAKEAFKVSLMARQVPAVGAALCEPSASNGGGGGGETSCQMCSA
jgi:ribonucleoside-diphosphate reductase alpha chain